MSVEVWTLKHPRLGLLEVRQGSDTEFRGDDPGWPLPTSADVPAAEPATDQAPSAEEETTDLTPSTAENTTGPTPTAAESPPREAASVIQNVRARLTGPPRRLQVRVNGEVTGRYERTRVDTIRLKNPKQDDSGFSPAGSAVGSHSPRLKIHASPLGDILSIQLRHGSSVVEFDAPPGSRGARRQAAMESSSFRQFLYPVLTGMGKAGWAILALVLLPIVARLLPDWDMELPAVIIPQIHLPTPRIPRIRLPAPTLPTLDVSLPSLPRLPDWVAFVLEYDHIWKPILIGIVLGVLAVRNHRRSKHEKASWAEGAAVVTDADDSTDATGK